MSDPEERITSHPLGKLTAEDAKIMANEAIDEYTMAERHLATRVADLLNDAPDYRDEILNVVHEQIGGDKLEALSHFRKEIAYGGKA